MFYKTNKYSLKELKSIININKVNNVKDDEIFDYLRIISMKKHKVEDKASNILFFPITLGKEWVKDGWLPKETKLKEHIDEIVHKFPDYTFVIEKDMIKKITLKEAKYIVVPNIMETIDIFYNYLINNYKFEVIAVTGSAGKTTAVGMIEQVLKTKYNVLRIYTDRITPIVLQAYIINFLNKETDIVALEMSIFFKNHVKVLNDMLKPSIAAIVNIGSAHLGNKGLKTIDDICIYKSKILTNAKIAYLNGDDDYLEKLKLKDNKIYYKNKKLFKTKLKELNNLYPSNVKIENNKMIINDQEIYLPILTELSIMQYLLAYNIGLYMCVDSNSIIKSLSKFKTVENRLQRTKIFGKEVIFDGDWSFKERFHQMSKHLYKEAYLVIRKYAGDSYKDDFVGIKEYFKNFKKVYLFDNINYLSELKNEKNVVVVNNHKFLKELPGEVFYHCHDYFYAYDELKEKNLK